MTTTSGSTSESRRMLPASLGGRCANGYERGQVVRVHAVPYSYELARKGYAITDEAVKNSASETLWCSPHCVPERQKQEALF